MYRIRSLLVLVTIVIIGIWFLVAAAAVLVCAAARRTDDEIARTERAPVIELDAAALSRRHSAA
jgi:heme O synthase-like polyprenyltransferase